MNKCYFELRTTSPNLAADMMHHLHTRQYLGKTLVICDQPASFSQEAHKQWLKLSRTIQRQRINTPDADKILKYTHTITHMQHMRFVAKTPLEAPDAEVYFLNHDQLAFIPLHCFNVYITNTLATSEINILVSQLPADALVIDYSHATQWHKYGLAAKRKLETRVSNEWHEVQLFLTCYRIDTRELFNGQVQSIEAVDNALDTLLGVSHKFLRVAENFNHALELARPLKLSKHIRQEYDAFALLAHRVQALSTPSFTQQFLETYSEDDTFFLQDIGRYLRRHQHLSGESLGEAVARHLHAGRHHLAQALRVHALR